MDEYKNLMQTFAKIKSDTDSIVETASKVMQSPEIQKIIEITESIKVTIPTAVMRFAEAVSPYAEIARRASENVIPIMEALAKASARLLVIDRLGKAEYVAWNSFSRTFFEDAARTKSAEGLLNVVYDYLQNDDFSGVNVTIVNLEKNEYLKDNPVFIQSIIAYKHDDYDLAALGLTAMIDRLLSVYSGRITDVSIQKRIDAIRKKIEESGEASLDEFEINDYILVSTYFNALSSFGRSAGFDKEEPNLNRHWIAHGRMDRKLEKIDCIRLINFLYGTILISKLGE